MRELTVQGVSPIRLTPRPNENIEVPDEVGRAIVARLLVRKLTEPRTVIAMAGLGLPQAAPTVLGHVRAQIMSAGLARVVANLQSRATSIPKPAPHFDVGTGSPHSVHYVDDEIEIGRDGIDSAGYDASTPMSIEVTLSLPGRDPMTLEGYSTDQPFEVEL